MTLTTDEAHVDVCAVATHHPKASSIVKRLYASLHKISDFLRDLSLVRTVVCNWRSNLRPFSIMLYPKTHFHVGPNAKVIHKSGHLRIGRRWSVARFRHSELIIADGGTLEVGGESEIFTGCSIIVDPGATLSLGSGCAINMNARIAVFNRVSIGNRALISENVTIRDSDNHAVTGGSEVVSAPIAIGDDVLIGVNSTILKGVSIGDGCVVAAGSVVTRSFEPRMLIGGVPARIIRANVNWKP
ncbi:MAG TPA: acyltransferase [Terriglobales bacterium]|nr:acyltransferase [Terriglobales bacterium]